MAFIGGYNIIDISRFGKIPVPGNIDITDEEVDKFSDLSKATFFAPFEVTITTDGVDYVASGFTGKCILAGAVTAVAVPGILISKTGDNKLTFSID